MKVIQNKIIPFGDFTALSFCGLIFVKDKGKVTEHLLRHEAIHWEQQKETFIVGFLLIYGILYLLQFIKGIFVRRHNELYSSLCERAYVSVAFEREAYYNQFNKNYLNSRRRYCWIKLIFSEYTLS